MKTGTLRKIKFWSLRSSVGSSGGVIYDCDAEIVKSCRVILTEDGLRWQLVKNAEYENSYCNEVDQECLNEYGLDEVEIVKQPMQKFIF